KWRVEFLAVGQAAAAGGGPPAIEAVHQRALARTTRPENANKLARLDGQVDAVEQHARLAVRLQHDLLQAARLQPHALAAVEDVDLARRVAQQERADAHALVFLDDHRVGEAAAVDGKAVEAA